MNKQHRERGAVAIIVGLLLFVFLGFAGLAVDLGYAYMKRTQLQSAADAEALACVVNPTAAQCPVSVTPTVVDLYPALSAPYNFSSNFTISTLNPGDNSLCPQPLIESNCASVTVTDTWNTFFIGLFGRRTLTIQAIAIAGKQGGGQGCVIASSYFSVSGSQGLNGSNCANYLGSVSINGNPAITGSANYIYNGNSGSSCTTCQPPAQSVNGPLTPPALADPVYKPAVAGTVGTGFTGSVAGTLSCPGGTTCTLQPGIYNNVDCSNSNSVCNLAPTGNSTPSQYTFEFDGTFIGPSNNGRMAGSGVRLYFGGGASQSITLGGGGQLTLSVPATGTCSSNVTPDSQIVIYAPNAATVSYNGNVATQIVGNVYMPNASFALGGNGGLNMNGTLIVSSYQNNGGGNSGLSVNGSNTCGYTPNGSGRVVLVQ